MSRTRKTAGSAALWGSAFVIFALVIVQAGRMPGTTAYGEAWAVEGDFELLTVRSGQGPNDKPNELLYMIDNRAGTLLIYEIENVQRGIFAREGGPIENLFNAARR